MSYATIQKIKQTLKDKGYATPDYSSQMFLRGESCIMLTSNGWNIGSMHNTSWPGISGKSYKAFAKAMGVS